ncbi:MAG: hypothetical protein ACJAVK_003262 [Akkermansiaceae bacterium]|jgi:hypothetical protein
MHRGTYRNRHRYHATLPRQSPGELPQAHEAAPTASPSLTFAKSIPISQSGSIRKPRGVFGRKEPSPALDGNFPLTKRKSPSPFREDSGTASVDGGRGQELELTDSHERLNDNDDLRWKILFQGNGSTFRFFPHGRQLFPQIPRLGNDQRVYQPGKKVSLPISTQGASTSNLIFRNGEELRLLGSSNLSYVPSPSESDDRLEYSFAQKF